MDEKALNLWVEQQGWSPDSPNDACRRAIARPPEFAHLSRTDGDGCHFLIVYMEYDRLLELGGIDDNDGHSFSLTAATYVVLKHNGAVPSSQAEFVEHAKEFQYWDDRVVAPATERMRALMRDHDQEWFMRNRALFEPAISLILVQQRFFPADVSADQVSMARGLDLHEEGSKRAQRKPEPMDGYAMMGYFDMIAKRPSRSVSKYGKDGLLRLDSMKVKQAFDEEFGRVTKKQRVPLLPENVEAIDRSTPVQQVSVEEVFEIARALAAAGGMKGRDKRAAEVIRDHLNDLINGSISMRKLAVMSGVSRPTLERAWTVLQERVARKLG